MMSLEPITQAPSMDLQNIRPSHFDLKPLPTLPSLSSDSNQQKRKRSPSKSSMKPNKVIKKSSSTPHMARPDGPGSADEKKRNKLGYHRTSVACGKCPTRRQPHLRHSKLTIEGHCRRRKIRCVMPDDDHPSGRCSNCIRLKKECNFYPVEAGKGPHPPQRGGSVPNHARPGHSSSPVVLSGYPEPFTYGTHTSYSVPPPETGLGLFNTSAAPHFTETSYSSSYDVPATTWDSSPHATLPPISGAPEALPYAYGMAGRHFESPLSVSPAPQQYARPSSTFRPSPFNDSAYASGGKTPNNEIGWAPTAAQQSAGLLNAAYHRPSYSPPPHSINESSRQSEQPPSLAMSSETASTPTPSESTTLGSMSVSAPGLWNPYISADPKPFSVSEPFDGTGSWFPEPLNTY